MPVSSAARGKIAFFSDDLAKRAIRRAKTPCAHTLHMTTRQLALGCMAMSGSYAPNTDAEGIATIHEAIDRGITLLDTGDFYGSGHNELLIGRAIRECRDKVRLSVKFGAMRAPGGMFIGIDSRPAAIKNF